MRRLRLACLAQLPLQPDTFGPMARTKIKKPKKAATPAYAAPALEKGMDIVELLAEEPAGLTISDIALRLGRSMGEVFRMIAAMQRREWLHKDPESDRFSVTFRILELGHRGTSSRVLALAAAPVMQELSRITDQSCHLVVRSGGRGVVIHRQENLSLQGGFSMRPGAAVDLLSSCSGHVLLAFTPADELSAVLQQLPSPLQSLPLALRSILERVSAQGYEMKPSARTAGVTDISYPIFGFAGRTQAALTIPYLLVIDDSLPKDPEETRAVLHEASRRISTALGGHPR
jgi:DNA-binding IclR family transcriptional regulator